MPKNTKAKKSVEKKPKKTANVSKKTVQKQTASKPKVQAKPPAPPASSAVKVTNEVVQKESILEMHTSKFKSVLKTIQALKSQLIELTSQVKNLQKSSEREIKKYEKQNKKNKSRKSNRAPSGFVKPALISKELASFLGKPVGTEMARTEVTREINQYIRSHKLQDPNNGRIINADTKLRKLLKLKKEDELTYFNLQRYMSPHFAKKGQPLVE